MRNGEGSLSPHSASRAGGGGSLYYESQAAGLGADFLLEVVAATDRITEFPAAWQEVDAELRRCRLARFPYGLVFAEDGDGILIVAVTHLHQRPRSWQQRLQDK